MPEKISRRWRYEMYVNALTSDVGVVSGILMCLPRKGRTSSPSHQSVITVFLSQINVLHQYCTLRTTVAHYMELTLLSSSWQMQSCAIFICLFLNYFITLKQSFVAVIYIMMVSFYTNILLHYVIWIKLILTFIYYYLTRRLIMFFKLGYRNPKFLSYFSP